MLASHIHEWINLLLKWIHLIVGIAWIGASFYFNWLERNLQRQAQPAGIAGTLWAIHGGGFYHLKKYKTAPDALPEPLHWFKWEAYATWISGFALLVVVYYGNARLYLINNGLTDLHTAGAIVISLVSILGSWFVYDLLCRSRLQRSARLLGLVLLVYFTLLAYVLSELFSGRATYIHVGAAMGTIMVANVFFVIIPSQKKMVAALETGQAVASSIGETALLRSTHNNYLTLPVLFTMISNHFAGTYGHRWNWLILLVLGIIGVAVRHYFNIRKQNPASIWILVASFVAFIALVGITAPLSYHASHHAAHHAIHHKQIGVADNVVTPATTETTTSNAYQVIAQRCVQCHSKTPTQAGFASAPRNIVLDTQQQIDANAQGIYRSVVITKTMPLANLTGITQQQRDTIAKWYQDNTNNQ